MKHTAVICFFLPSSIMQDAHCHTRYCNKPNRPDHDLSYCGFCTATIAVTDKALLLPCINILKHKEFNLNIRKKLCMEDGLALGQVAQRDCGFFIFGDIQNPAGQCPEKSALFDPALNSRVGVDRLQRSLAVSIIL